MKRSQTFPTQSCKHNVTHSPQNLLCSENNGKKMNENYAKLKAQ